MSCATSTLKITLIILNALCFLSGTLILSASIYGLSLNFESLTSRFAVSIGLDSCLIFLSIFSCVAAFKESVRFWWAYVILMIALVVAQMTYAWLGQVNYESLAKDYVDSLWKQIVTDPEPMWKLQTLEQCCGKYGPSDYADSGLPIPPSCYAGENTNTTSNLNVVGCYETVNTILTNKSHIGEISEWSLIGIEGLTVIIAVIMVFSLSHEQRRLRYR